MDKWIILLKRLQRAEGEQRRGSFSLPTLCSSLLLFPHSLASSKKQSAAARKDGIPFIKCQVCEKIAHQIIHRVKQKEAQISPKEVRFVYFFPQISEFQIIEIAENICNLKKDESDWILQIDFVEKGDKLELVEQGIEGICNSECKSIEHACQEILSYSDTDVAEFVYSTRPSVDQLISFLCKDLSKACFVKPPPLLVDRIAGEAFIAKSTKEAEMDKILRSMEGMPAAPGMNMYSRGDLMSGNFGSGDENDDEEDEEDNFSEKLVYELFPCCFHDSKTSFLLFSCFERVASLFRETLRRVKTLPSRTIDTRFC
ncbi:hypothetical protein ZIOFF_050296 [Zingiber officinale]|uniref:Saposin B-type domain-containing protein n=1 Tax=Zingiber officinale TaxID=94328 RepID=A0A8J5FKY5_ZINOF|nr:hypothetical protein ZIOFF_050296 [Zingiber officinale]